MECEPPPRVSTTLSSTSAFFERRIEATTCCRLIYLLIPQFPQPPTTNQPPPPPSTTTIQPVTMKTFTLAAASTLAITAILSAPAAAVHPHFRHLQQNGNNMWRPQNAFPANNANNWQAANAGGNQWGNQWGNQGAGTSPEAFPQTGGAAVSDGQQAEAAGAVQPEGSPEDTNSTEAPAANSATTEAPAAGAGSAQSTEPAQSTIMVLLPDFLAPTYSGSGSTMVIAGVTDSSKAGESGATGSAGTSGTEVKSSAVGQSSHSVATVLAITSAVILGLLF